MTFDRVPLSQSTQGLDYDAISQDPVREAVIELVDSADTVLQTLRTDANGDYSFDPVTSGTTVRVRVLARLLRTTGPSEINLSVVDNTNSNALYAIQGALADASDTTATRNLNAASGWTGSSYTETRAAAPFALLDTFYTTTETFRDINPDVDFPQLQVFWSPNNRAVNGNVSQGEIGTSSYTRTNGIPTIRILGDADMDTDEYDVSVVIHEWGHYFEDAIARSDSLGGQHSLSSLLDVRVGFSEGFANAITGFIHNVIYRDSFGASQSQDFGFSLESNAIGAIGWYSESSVQSILFDIMDSDNDGADTVSAGLAPIYRAFTSSQFLNAPEALSIFAFADALESEGTVSRAEIDALLSQQNITGRGSRGAGEIDDGGIPSTLPIYKTLTVGGPAVQVCSVNDAGSFNKHGNRAFLMMDVTSPQSITITATTAPGQPGNDPDFRVYRDGNLIVNALAAPAASETNTRNYEADEYFVVVWDDANVSGNGAGIDTCIDVQAN